MPIAYFTTIKYIFTYYALYSLRIQAGEVSMGKANKELDAYLERRDVYLKGIKSIVKGHQELLRFITPENIESLAAGKGLPGTAIFRGLGYAIAHPQRTYKMSKMAENLGATDQTKFLKQLLNDREFWDQFAEYAPALHGALQAAVPVFLTNLHTAATKGKTASATLQALQKFGIHADDLTAGNLKQAQTIFTGLIGHAFANQDTVITFAKTYLSDSPVPLATRLLTEPVFSAVVHYIDSYPFPSQALAALGPVITHVVAEQMKAPATQTAIPTPAATSPLTYLTTPHVLAALTPERLDRLSGHIRTLLPIVTPLIATQLGPLGIVIAPPVLNTLLLQVVEPGMLALAKKALPLATKAAISLGDVLPIAEEFLPYVRRMAPQLQQVVEDNIPFITDQLKARGILVKEGALPELATKLTDPAFIDSVTPALQALAKDNPAPLEFAPLVGQVLPLLDHISIDDTLLQTQLAMQAQYERDTPDTPLTFAFIKDGLDFAMAPEIQAALTPERIDQGCSRLIENVPAATEFAAAFIRRRSGASAVFEMLGYTSETAVKGVLEKVVQTTSFKEGLPAIAHTIKSVLAEHTQIQAILGDVKKIMEKTDADKEHQPFPLIDKVITLLKTPAVASACQQHLLPWMQRNASELGSAIEQAVQRSPVGAMLHIDGEKLIKTLSNPADLQVLKDCYQSLRDGKKIGALWQARKLSGDAKEQAWAVASDMLHVSWQQKMVPNFIRNHILVEPLHHMLNERGEQHDLAMLCAEHVAASDIGGVKEYSLKARDLSGIRLQDTNMEGMTIESFSFAKGRFTDISFVNASLKNCNFSKVTLRGDIDFSGMTIDGASLATLLPCIREANAHHRTKPALTLDGVTITGPLPKNLDLKGLGEPTIIGMEVLNSISERRYTSPPPSPNACSDNVTPLLVPRVQQVVPPSRA
jgi:hypothetical protein